MRLRNQYDDEASRLVKIHQLEFPNYKYQPKKRVPLNGAQSTTMSAFPNTTACFISGTNSANSQSVAELATLNNANNNSSNKITSRDTECVRVPNRSELMGTVLSIRPHLNVTQASTTHIGPSVASETNVRLISPSKGIVKTVFTRLEPKRHNTMHGCPGTLTAAGSCKTAAQSLSTVLPPLITQSFSCSIPGSARSLSTSSTDPFQIGSCDSAYASGINSSSSSSASSPAVGDLLSPAKSLASVPVSGSRSSPFRRKVQLIPIRPQSQQAQQQQSSTSLIGEMPTRQRFFSADSETTNSFSVTSPITESSNTSELVYFMPVSSLSSCTSSTSSINQQSTTHTDGMDEVDSAVANPFPVNQIPRQSQQAQSNSQTLTPVYVKLNTNSARPNEELILALPPGTTVIQALGNLGQLQTIPVPSTCSSAMTSISTSSINSLPGRRVYVASTGSRSNHTNTYGLGRSDSSSLAPFQVFQPVKVMNVFGRTVRAATEHLMMQSGTRSGSDEFSPTPSYSPSSSALSPQSNDVFLPMHQHLNASGLSETKLKLEVGRERFEVDDGDEILTDEVRGSGGKHESAHGSSVVDRSVVKLEQSPALENAETNGTFVKMEEDDYVYMTDDSVFGSTMLDGSVAPWSNGDANMRESHNPHQPQKCPVASHHVLTYCPVGFIAPLPPLTVDVLKSTSSPCPTYLGTAATPSLIATHEVDAVNVSNSANATVTTTASIGGAQTPTTEFPMCTEDDQFDTSFDAMMNSIDITAFLPGTFPGPDDQLVDSVFDTSDTNRNHGSSKPNSTPGLDPIDQESSNLQQPFVHSYDHSDFPCRASSCSSSCSQSSVGHSVCAISPLADLDALEESSLFLIKPEWPVIV